MRERVLQAALVVIGSVLVLLAVPGVMFFSREPAVAMIMSLYVPMGIFLLRSARNPAAHRSLIAYTGWANVSHAAVMTVQEFLKVIQRQELIGVAIFGVVGVTLVALTPAKEAAARAAEA